MPYNVLNFRIIGVSPLVMRNGQLANPLNRFAKDIKTISTKRKKTEADIEEIARLEWLGSLYLTKGEPCISGEMVEACIIRGAFSQKRGKHAKAGILSLGAFPLKYEGPRNPLELWQLEGFRLVAGVKVGNSRLMRTRPIFRDWGSESDRVWYGRVGLGSAGCGMVRLGLVWPGMDTGGGCREASRFSH